MSARKFYLFFILLSLALSASASDRDSSNCHFAYDMFFEFNFDNRENGHTQLSPSRTILGAGIMPAIGVSIDDNNGKMNHRLMAGIDLMKDLGKSPVSPELVSPGSDDSETSQSHLNLDLFGELLLYYQLNTKMGRTDFTMTAGIFPKLLSEFEYPDAFLSDSLKFYDSIYEGMMLSFKRPKSYYEVGCDWMGMYGNDRRERFMIFSAGKSDLNDWLSLGYYASMYHYAGSRKVQGVVDNILVNPWICFDFASMTPFQNLSLTLGWLQGAQNDRRNIGEYVFPGGGELTFEIRKWNAGLMYYGFFGKDMMPYYDYNDAGGCKYGSMLYFGDPFYRINDGKGGFGVYSKAEIFYEPKISDYLSLRVSATAHFHKKFLGWQQQLGLVFNLRELVSKVSRKK